MVDEEICKQIEISTRLAAAMPPWKRNILVQSGQPTVDPCRYCGEADDYACRVCSRPGLPLESPDTLPRKPVDNFNGDRDY